MDKKQSRQAPTRTELQEALQHEAVALALALKHHRRWRLNWWTRPEDTSVFAEAGRGVIASRDIFVCWKVTGLTESLYVGTKGRLYQPVTYRTDVPGLFLDPLVPSNLDFMQLENFVEALRIMRYRLGK